MKRVTFDLPGGTLSALRFGDPDAPPRLIFCHANGFNAQSYVSVLKPLGVPALALDLRGHGRTELPTDPGALASWDIFADDIATLFDRVVRQPVVLAGHSYGAASAILSLARTRDKVVGYAGFDPVIVPWLFWQITRSKAGRTYMKARIPIARKAGSRRSEFDSLDAAFARYQGRGAFRNMPDVVLRDYLEGGLLPTDDGRVRLACDPQWEQAIFAAQAHNMMARLPRLPDNSRIVFAGLHGKVSTAGLRRKVARLQPAISVEYEAGKTHLFPLEEPTFATSVLRSVLDAA